MEANPSYLDKMHLIREWYVEFAPDGSPWREVGIDSTGKPVVAGPCETDYGFWLDTNMRIDDFEGEPIEAAEFERVWTLSGVKELE